MPDYSCIYRVVNNLDVALKRTIHSSNTSRQCWHLGPLEVIPPHQTCEKSQIKNLPGLNGTDGWVDYEFQYKEVTYHVDLAMICSSGTGSAKNAAAITSNLLGPFELEVSEYEPRAYPLEVVFTINPTH